MAFCKNIIMLTVTCGAFAFAAHAQTSTATPESVYNALTARIDTLVNQNSGLADSYAKLLTCNRLQMFYAPDAPGADGQGCVAGGGGSSAMLGGGGKWVKLGCNSSESLDMFSARNLPDCPSQDMQGQACGDIGLRCKTPGGRARNCHLGEHENKRIIDGFLCAQ